jgi:4-aminobutyrate aminotransferase-like enzyme
LTDLTLRVVKQMLHRGFILLPEGDEGNVIGFTPPLTISRRQVEAVVEELDGVLASEAHGLPVLRRKRGGRRISRRGSP